MLCCLSIGKASVFYVSPTGSDSGSGTMSDPWSLQAAYDHPMNLLPGDTVWMRGGVYTNTVMYDPSFGFISYNCKTKGTTNAPILFRNYDNEHVTIDGETNQVVIFAGNCSNTWFWGIEVMSSAIIRSSNRSYIYCTAPNMKFINMNLHDLADGIDLWNAAKGAELYGCLIYHNGWDQVNPNLAHGHGIYTQNDTTNTRIIENNIFFSSYAYNLKLWSTNQGIDNYNIHGNIVFNGGSASQFSDSRKANFFVVSNNLARPIRNLNMSHNYTYAGIINSVKGLCNVLGDGEIIHGTIDSNYFLGQLRGLGPYTDMTAIGNTIYGGTALNYTNNSALFDSTFSNSTQSQNIPVTGLDYFVLPNKYETGRASIAIYNWSNADHVEINVSDIGLQPGDQYELVNVMDYYNDFSVGTYPTDGNITVPMTGHSFAPVISGAVAPVSQFPTFGAFLIRKAAHPLAAAEIQVLEGTTSIADGSVFSFGTTPVGTDITKIFTIKNSGVLPLDLGPLSALPAGFSLVGSFLSSPVAPGSTVDFTIQLDASVVSHPSGLISFTTNDPDENPFHFTIEGIATIPGYCPATSSQPQFIWIKGVSLNGTTSTSAGSGYSDITATTFSADGGATLPITLDPGYNNSNVTQPYDVTWSIWMDLNTDFDFSDAGENVLNVSGSTHETLVADILIPDQNVSTRMRVSMCLEGFGEQPLDCGTITYGEVEDYTVDISQGPTRVSDLYNRIESSVVPNPFADQCVIQVQNAKGIKYVVKIYSLLGEIMQQVPFADNQASITRASMTSGLYYYLVQDENGVGVSSGKLIVI